MTNVRIQAINKPSVALDKMFELVGGWSVITGAYPIQFKLHHWFKSYGNVNLGLTKRWSYQGEKVDKEWLVQFVSPQFMVHQQSIASPNWTVSPTRPHWARQRQGRGGDGNRPTGSLEAPTQVRPPGSGERGRWDQPPPGYSRQFPMLTRGRTKMEAESSGLDDVIKEILQEGGCNNFILLL